MISEAFKKAYKKLNPAQKKAVDAIDGPVMVIAGPGTGKTQILTMRIANILLKTDTPPDGILALTFTEAGEKTMRARLREIIGNSADKVRIHTYHGFAASIISDFPEHFPELHRVKQLNDVEAESLLRDILKEKKFAKLRPLGEPDFYVGKILGAISDCKKEAWTPEMISQFAKGEIEKVKKDESSISTRGITKGKLKADALKRIEKCERTIIFADVYETYEKSKREKKRIDYDDLIFELIREIREDELLLRLIQEKFLYILVDEHQDTNDSQNLVIKTMADFFDNPNLFVVGDEKQAIYRFQGASVENFLKFQNIWKDMKVISLSENYRSHQGILDAAFRMIENNYEEDEHKNLRVKLLSRTGEEPRPVDVVFAGNLEASEKYLVRELKKIADEEPERTVAIIVRTNRNAERALSLLEMHSLPVSAERGADIFSHPAGALYFFLLEFLADNSKTESLAKTIAGGIWHLNFETGAKLIKDIRSGNVFGVAKKIPAISKLNREISRAGVIEFLTLSAELSGFTEIVARDPLSVEVWRGIVSLAQDIVLRNEIQDPRVLIEELLSYRASAEKKSVKILAGPADSQIRVMTAHGSKGLEYDYVFLPYATEESWMSGKRGSFFVMPREKEEGDEERDSRRLFYVALTRAKNHVSIIIPLQDGLGKELLPLRFVSELDPKNVSRTDIPASYEKPVSVDARKLESKRQSELVEYAKNSLLKVGLSVTALNHFRKCSLEFFYQSILKLPEPPSGSSEKGNAMHEAFSEVWHLENKSEKNIAAKIESAVKNYFDRSLLPSFEKEVAVEELVKNAPKVSAALASHFAMKGEVSSEKWIETRFEEIRGKEKLAIKLHGKLDAIVLSGDDCFVFDYKTTEAKSVADIKGETKDSDGGYFRQLIFYKILLQGDSFYKGKNVEPSLVFVKPDKKDRCPAVSIPISDDDILRVKSEIKTLIESVWSGNFLSQGCGEKDCEWCKLRKVIGG